MKRLCAMILIAASLCFCSGAGALEDPSNSPVDLTKAEAAILVNLETGRTILGKDTEKPVEAAGLVRLPALLTVCRAFDEGRIKPGDTVTVVPEAATVRGATAFLSPNERIDADELLKASAMLLAGDAVCALIRAAYPGEAASISAVNEVLARLGIGQIGESSLGTGRKFTVSELAKVCMALSESGSWRKYSSVYLDTLTHENAPPTELTNPNRLVRFYSGCFGIATGSVGAAQYCGAFIAKRGSTTYLAIVAGLPDSASRFALASEMLDYGFSAYRAVEIGADQTSELKASVSGGKSVTVKLTAGDDLKALLPVTDTKVLTEAVIPEYVEAPIIKGAEIGTLIMKNARGETLGEIPLKAAETVERALWKDRFMALIADWLHIEKG